MLLERKLSILLYPHCYTSTLQYGHDPYLDPILSLYLQFEITTPQSSKHIHWVIFRLDGLQLCKIHGAITLVYGSIDACIIDVDERIIERPAFGQRQCSISQPRCSSFHSGIVLGEIPAPVVVHDFSSQQYFDTKTLHGVLLIRGARSADKPKALPPFFCICWMIFVERDWKASAGKRPSTSRTEFASSR